MSNAFLILERVGDGYFMKPTEGRDDVLMFIEKFDFAGTGAVSTEVAWEDYTAVIAGFSTNVDQQDMFMVRDLSDGFWYINCTSMTGFVNVLFIHRSMCNDDTVTTQA